MSEEPMEWEKAEERFTTGYSDFNTSVIYVFAFVIALMFWMFFYIVMGWASIHWFAAIVVGIISFIVFMAIGAAAAMAVKKMLVG